MHEGVDPVDGRRHPGHEQRDEEQQRDLRVAPHGAVSLHRGAVLAALHGHDAGVRGRGPGRHGRGHDVDGVLLVVRARGGAALAAALGARIGSDGRDGCWVRGGRGELADDLDVGRFEAVEGVEVARGVEGAELLAFLEELAPGDGVDCEGGEDGDPGWGVAEGEAEVVVGGGYPAP